MNVDEESMAGKFMAFRNIAKGVGYAPKVLLS